MLTHFHISQQGQRHIETSTPCQDHSSSRRVFLETLGYDVVLAAVADGVGSCKSSQHGAQAAVSGFLDCMERNLVSLVSAPTEDALLDLFRHSFGYALRQVEREAEKRDLPLHELDSTLTGILYNGHDLWFGHIGDDGVVALYSDGDYEMITRRHKGEEANSLFPLRERTLWQFGKAKKEVVSCILMTDGVLDHCVDGAVMGNRVYFPFLEPALTTPAESEEAADRQRLDWEEYLSGQGSYPDNFRHFVTDDISFVMVQNPDLVKALPVIPFDFDAWDAATKRRRKELDDALYADYRAYKAGTYKSPTGR